MKHEVDFRMPENELGNADLEFKVRRNNQVVGTLKLSRGAVVWVPRDCSYGHKLGWTEFATIMETNGPRENGKS